jgi:hypothetical protein
MGEQACVLYGAAEFSRDTDLAKKTQRDKDWPMVRRLVEAHYFQNRDHPTASHVRFWLHELRSPELLVALANDRRDLCRRLSGQRPLLKYALKADQAALDIALREEESREREADRRYWQPLRAELEQFRALRFQDR